MDSCSCKCKKKRLQACTKTKKGLSAHSSRIEEMKEEWTQEKLNKDLKKEHTVKKEGVEQQYSYLVSDITEYFENRRKELLKITKNIKYTQKNVAEEAGITVSTYKNYLSNKNYNISFITVYALADILQCDLPDIIKSIITKK